MSDIRCPTCDAMLGRKVADGSVEIREKRRLVAKVRWGRLGCSRCGHEVAADVVPPVDARQLDRWEVVGSIK